jgi:hypothetical protein
MRLPESLYLWQFFATKCKKPAEFVTSAAGFCTAEFLVVIGERFGTAGSRMAGGLQLLS